MLFTNSRQEREIEKLMQEVPRSPSKYGGSFKLGRDFYFKDKAHQKRWKDIGGKWNQQRTPLGFMAAMYLIASDDSLWAAVQGRYSGTAIDFERICAENYRLDSLILLEVAKRVYHDIKSLTLGEIFKSTTMHLELQKMLINSYFILEYDGGEMQ